MTDKQARLDVLADQLRISFDSAFEHDVKSCTLILEVREQFFANNNTAWIDWARENLHISVWECWRAAWSAQAIRECARLGIDIKSACRGDFERLEVIALIPPPHIGDFLHECDAAGLNEDDLPDQVRSFLERRLARSS